MPTVTLPIPDVKIGESVVLQKCSANGLRSELERRAKNDDSQQFNPAYLLLSNESLIAEVQARGLVVPKPDKVRKPPAERTQVLLANAWQSISHWADMPEPLRKLFRIKLGVI